MTFRYGAPRIRHQSTSTGTGPYRFSGAAASTFRTFLEVFGAGAYVRTHAESLDHTQWEEGEGDITDEGGGVYAISRARVLRSSASGGLVDFAAAPLVVSPPTYRKAPAGHVVLANGQSLPAHSPRLIFASMTVGSQVLTLPNALLLPPGDRWTVYNTGSRVFKIKTSGGQVVVNALYPGDCVILVLADNNASDGAWFPWFPGAKGTPIGAIAYWPGETDPPPRWIYLYGQALSRSKYGLLFEKWGTQHGAGDGVSTFNAPDARGYVFAGMDKDGVALLTPTGCGITPATLGATGGSPFLHGHNHGGVVGTGATNAAYAYRSGSDVHIPGYVDIFGMTTTGFTVTGGSPVFTAGSYYISGASDSVLLTDPLWCPVAGAGDFNVMPAMAVGVMAYAGV